MVITDKDFKVKISTELIYEVKMSLLNNSMFSNSHIFPNSQHLEMLKKQFRYQMNSDRMQKQKNLGVD